MRSDLPPRLLRHSAFIVAAACVSCAGLKTPFPDKSFFALDPGRPDAVVPASAPSTDPSAAPVIQISRVQVASPYDEPHFVYKTSPVKFETDYYNTFMTRRSKST